MQACCCVCYLQGLIFTAGAMWNTLQWLNIPIHVQEVRAVSLGLGACWEGGVSSKGRAGEALWWRAAEGWQ